MRDEFDTIQNRSRWISVLTACWFLLGIQTANAGTNVVEVPAVLSLPTGKSELDATLAKLLGQTFSGGYVIDQSVADLIIRDPFEIRLSGVRITGTLRGRTEIDSRGVIGEALLTGLKVTVGRISIHTLIRSEIGGVDARIRLDADCTSTVVDWKETEIPVFLRARILLGQTQPSLDLDGLTLSTLFQKPEMLMTCTGPSGVDAVLRDQAWNVLVERWTDTAFLEEVQSAIEASINSGMKPGGEGFALSAPTAGKSPSGASLMGVRLKATSFKVDASGAHLLGVARFELDRPIQEVPTSIDVERLVPQSITRDITLSMATDAIESLLQTYFDPEVWSHWIPGQEIEGFRDLMSSRFSQFFAFPALMDFPKDAPMAFASSFTGRMTLKCTNAGDIQLEAPIGSWMVLQNDSQMGFQPLVHFSLPTTLRLRKPTTGRPEVSVQKMSLSSTFHPKYIDSHSPNTSIAHETLLERIQPAVEAELASFVATSQIVQAAQGLIMGCEPASQVMRLTAP